MGRTYLKAPEDVAEKATELMLKHPEFKHLVDNRVTINYLMAYGAIDDETGERTNYAIEKDGRRIYAETSIHNIKLRTLGLADARITIDGDWWKDAPETEQYALLDHELCHISFEGDTDDLNRPKLSLAPHDYELHVFRGTARRHGKHSFERKYCEQIMEESGQLFWPEIAPEMSVDEDDHETPVGVHVETRKAAEDFRNVLKQHGATVTMTVAKTS